MAQLEKKERSYELPIEGQSHFEPIMPSVIPSDSEKAQQEANTTENKLGAESNSDTIGSHRIRQREPLSTRNQTHAKSWANALCPMPLGLGRAYSENDCFFDAVVQVLPPEALKESKNSEALSRLKWLRMVCSREANKIHQTDPAHNWIKRWDTWESSDVSYEKYLSCLQYAFHEVGKQGVTDMDIVRGDPDIEGRIICAQFNLTLHVMGWDEINSQIVHKIVSTDSDNPMDFVEAHQVDYDDANLIHIAQYKDHFVPLVSQGAKSLSLQNCEMLKEEPKKSSSAEKPQGIPKSQPLPASTTHKPKEKKILVSEGFHFEGLSLAVISSESKKDPPLRVEAKKSPEAKPSALIQASGIHIIIPCIAYTALDFGERVKLGEGSYGAVFLAHINLNTVAVKEFKEVDVSEKMQKAFSREATAMAVASSESNYLLPLKAFCLQPYCLVMDYMPGGNLYHLLHSNQALSWNKRTLTALDVSRGLYHLHSRGIIHGDIKSDNVFLVSQSFDTLPLVKLGDFGNIRLHHHVLSSNSNKEFSGGAYRWAAPELFVPFTEMTQASDLWSFGVLLFELASREIPYRETRDSDLIKEWIKQGKLIEKFPSDTPAEFKAIAAECLQLNPEARPQALKVAQRFKALWEHFNATPREEQKNTVHPLDSRNVSDSKKAEPIDVIVPPVLEEEEQKPLQAPFIQACEQGDLSRVQAFLAQGVIPDPVTSGKNPLYAAVWGMNPEVVESLIQYYQKHALPIRWEDCEQHNHQHYGRTFYNLKFDPHNYQEWGALLEQIAGNAFLMDCHVQQMKQSWQKNSSTPLTFSALKKQVSEWEQLLSPDSFKLPGIDETQQCYDRSRTSIQQAMLEASRPPLEVKKVIPPSSSPGFFTPPTPTLAALALALKEQKSAGLLAQEFTALLQRYKKQPASAQAWRELIPVVHDYLQQCLPKRDTLFEHYCHQTAPEVLASARQLLQQVEQVGHQVQQCVGHSAWLDFCRKIQEQLIHKGYYQPEAWLNEASSAPTMATPVPSAMFYSSLIAVGEPPSDKMTATALRDERIRRQCQWERQWLEVDQTSLEALCVFQNKLLQDLAKPWGWTTFEQQQALQKYVLPAWQEDTGLQRLTQGITAATSQTWSVWQKTHHLLQRILPRLHSCAELTA